VYEALATSLGAVQGSCALCSATSTLNVYTRTQRREERGERREERGERREERGGRRRQLYK
jgi:hypothetical protein